MNQMRVGFFQFNVFWRDGNANLSYVGDAIKDSVFDLLVLPELFTSGYAIDTKDEIMPFAENLNDSYTVRYLSQVMKGRKGIVVGSIPELHNDKLYNTAIAVGSSGLVASYRKVHLPDYEKRFFSSGAAIGLYEYESTKIGLTICFDCWFAPLSSMLRLNGVDIICHSACFGGKVTPTIIPVRALENQCFVISCNRIGSELFDGESESYRGESQIVDPDGNVLVRAGNEESLTIISIDTSKVNSPVFGSLISQDFFSEHTKYDISLF